MESMFRKSLTDMEEHVLLDVFETRCSMIVKKIEGIGWGFEDAMTDLYTDFFENSCIR